MKNYSVISVSDAPQYIETVYDDHFAQILEPIRLVYPNTLDKSGQPSPPAVVLQIAGLAVSSDLYARAQLCNPQIYAGALQKTVVPKGGTQYGDTILNLLEERNSTTALRLFFSQAFKASGIPLNNVRINDQNRMAVAAMYLVRATVKQNKPEVFVVAASSDTVRNQQLAVLASQNSSIHRVETGPDFSVTGFRTDVSPDLIQRVVFSFADEDMLTRYKSGQDFVPQIRSIGDEFGTISRNGDEPIEERAILEGLYSGIEPMHHVLSAIASIRT
jgi:hypothetical protein